MSTWPCRCEMCAPPLDSCDACGAPEGEVCSDWCSEHPRHNMPCAAMSLVGRLSALGVLLRNLAVAGALCQAYWTGREEGVADMDPMNGLIGAWRPGCGREVPR